MIPLAYARLFLAIWVGAYAAPLLAQSPTLRRAIYGS